MKRVFLILIPFLLLVFLFSSVLAIERTPKKNSTASKEQKEEVKPSTTQEGKEGSPSEEVSKKKEAKQIDLKKQEKEKEKEKGILKIIKKLKPSQEKKLKQRYDYFIDKNGNGIDDRLEKKKIEKKSEKKTEKKKAPSQRKTRQKR